MIKPPILYTFRRCPYAMRARLALVAAKQNVIIREVVLADKPKALLQVSKKATVPVLVFDNGLVIDESLDIMNWAYTNMANELANNWQSGLDNSLIKQNDTDFKYYIDRYKYPEKYDVSPTLMRTHAKPFLLQLESALFKNSCLLSEHISFLDLAIFPFIRQFAQVDKTWFFNGEWQLLTTWLNKIMETPLFEKAMKKYTQWKEGDSSIHLLEELSSP